MTNPNLPPAPEGAAVYVHPQQDKTIYVLADGSMQVYKANGTRATSSATPAKLAAGYGAWERVVGTSAPVPTTAAPSRPSIGYLAPQLATEAALSSIGTYVTDDGWVLEQKLDGHRVLLVSPGGDSAPIALTRAGTPYTRTLPRALREFRFPDGIDAGAFVLDGELVGTVYYAFDIVRSPSTDASTPLSTRRYALEQIFPLLVGDNTAIRLIPQARTMAEKAALTATAVESNFEGLVAKRTDVGYRMGGRTEEWLKLKFVTTADCIVASVRDDGKDSVGLAVLDANGERVPVGRASLIGKEKRGQIVEDDVVEVRYLYVGAGGRLYQPAILRKRDDKPAHECTIDQLKHVNKSVLQHLPEEN